MKNIDTKYPILNESLINEDDPIFSGMLRSAKERELKRILEILRVYL